MTAHNKYPFRDVASATLHDEKSGRFWRLVLECGHEDTRPIRYDPTKNNAGRGGSRKQAVRSLDDVMPHPQRIRCDQCR
jgi:hypothetical protein